ncbi:MAG: pilus assembly protein [Peptoniphilaceae bacterium]|nr:pilus assembly protein [Peptoniphilaceae bacterium]MDY5766682.1 TadE family protein [Peptoniphilaceae bacterium]
MLIAKQKNNKESGAITIEAALVLGIFILIMVSWMLIQGLLKIQSMSRYALTQSVLAYADHLSLQNAVELGKISRLRSSPKSPLFLQGNSFDLDVLSQKAEGKGENFAADRLFQYYFGKSGMSADRGLEKLKERRLTIFRRGDNILEADLTYRLELPGVFRFLKPIEVHQYAVTGIWLINRNQEDQVGETGDNGEASIWHLPPFTRGRKLVEQRRRNTDASVFQKGQGIDLLLPDRSVESVFSLNLFSKSYSSGQGDRAENYQLNYDGIRKQMLLYAREQEKNLRRESFLLENGTSVKNDFSSRRVLLILPEEAKAFEVELAGLARDLGNSTGAQFLFQYTEKALFKEKNNEIP